MNGSVYGRRAVTAFGIVTGVALAVTALFLFGLINLAADLRRTLATQEAAAQLVAAGTGTVADTRFGGALPHFETVSVVELQAAVQSTVQAVVSARRFDVTTLQPLRPDRVAGLTRQTIRLEGTVPEAALAELLGALAAHRPLLLVQDIAIKPATVLASFQTGTDTEPLLTVKLDVTGYGSAPQQRDAQGGRR